MIEMAIKWVASVLLLGPTKATSLTVESRRSSLSKDINQLLAI